MSVKYSSYSFSKHKNMEGKIRNQIMRCFNHARHIFSKGNWTQSAIRKSNKNYILLQPNNQTYVKQLSMSSLNWNVFGAIMMLSFDYYHYLEIKTRSSLMEINKRFININISNEPWAISDNISTVHCTLYVKIRCNYKFNLSVVRCHGSLILILWPKDIAKQIIAN